MSYRSPAKPDLSIELHTAELEVLRLQEENQKLREMLRTELSRPPFKPKVKLPELLNASLLYEPSPFYRAFRAIRCFQGKHRWVPMLNLEATRKAWRKWYNTPAAEKWHWTDNPIYFACKIQCRDCKLIGKESMEDDPAKQVRMFGTTEYYNLYSFSRDFVSEVEKHLRDNSE